MFIHCNLWLVYLSNANSLSLSFFYDCIVTYFPYEKLLFILIEITTNIMIWNYNCLKMDVRYLFDLKFKQLFLRNICCLTLSTNRTALRYSPAPSNWNPHFKYFQQVQPSIKYLDRRTYCFSRFYQVNLGLTAFKTAFKFIG